MESEGGVFSTHPFLLELVKRSLTAALEEEARKAKKEDDLLIKP
jgi:mannose/fructose/N-acetylgalactosamine-specific phosphotransferase system component IID